ncbi:GNAT family N-acetyltransferase [Candidatus Thorarchaeota archaeon]|nr:MAG: GNAT family N-acetyltransferase [Candidatus Thorarchaeota archaeon]
MTIRRATLAEVDIVKAIINEAYEPVKKKLSRMPAALKEGLDKISRHIQMGDQYVALVGEQVVGTMRVRIRGNVGVIARVAVRETFRGRRIGTMLVEYAENLVSSRGASTVEVEVYGAIEMQLSFYQKIGYTETGRMERLGEEIVVMVKDLTESSLSEQED